MVEEELAKAQARAEIYEFENKIGRCRKSEPSTPNDVHANQGISTTENLEETKQKEVQNEKWKRMFKTQQKSEQSYLAIISDVDSRRNMGKLYPSWSNGDEEGVSHSSSAQKVYFNEYNSYCEDKKDLVAGLQNNIREISCKLVKKPSAPQVDLEPFDGNTLEYTYFMLMFRESVEKKVEDPKGRLTRLIQYTKGEAKDLIKNFINDRPEYGYNNAMAVLRRQYGNPHTLLSSYRREVRQMIPLKAGDATAFRKLFNFLIKCQTIEFDGHYNPLDTPEIICMVLSQLPLHLQDRWNRHTLQLRRKFSKEPSFENSYLIISKFLFKNKLL